MREKERLLEREGESVEGEGSENGGRGRRVYGKRGKF